MIQRFLNGLRPSWRTVAVVGRSCGDDKIFDVTRGVVPVPYTTVRYGFMLQESARGRRRVRTVIENRLLTRGQTRQDPIWSRVAAWRRGGPLPVEARLTDAPLGRCGNHTR